MDKDFLAALRRLRKQATESEQTLLSYLIGMAEIEAKNIRKAA